jgi:hypothetical protein
MKTSELALINGCLHYRLDAVYTDAVGFNCDLMIVLKEREVIDFFWGGDGNKARLQMQMLSFCFVLLIDFYFYFIFT